MPVPVLEGHLGIPTAKLIFDENYLACITDDTHMSHVQGHYYKLAKNIQRHHVDYR